MEAIETRYKNYRFRSRTEARWAVFFDALGVQWEYEPEGYRMSDGTMYLPDFHLPGRGLWVEIKGKDPTGEEDNKAHRLAHESGRSVLLLSGIPQAPQYRHPAEGDHWYYSAGSLDENMTRRWIVTKTVHEMFGITDERDPRLLAAYGEAAGARFEHGERPNARRLS